MILPIERDPEECVDAIVEDHVHAGFVVHLGRADGAPVPPIFVGTTARAIELVLEMNPARIHLRVAAGEARDAMLAAFVDVEVERTQRPTLH